MQRRQVLFLPGSFLYFREQGAVAGQTTQVLSTVASLSVISSVTDKIRERD